jgi:hypothetical protein
MKCNGKVVLTTRPVITDSIIHKAVSEESQAITLLKCEQYLNNEVATKMFQKFGVMLRVHLVGKEE